MAFHPDKCSTLRISRARKPITPSYTLQGHTLGTEDSTRYLGTDLQSKLSWNRHIDQVVKKGNSVLGFLRRNLKVSNGATKTSAYFSLVRPAGLQCCCNVWSPYPQEATQKLEIVQRRAAIYVTNRYRNTSSVTLMLDHLHWKSLESIRVKCQLTMMFKTLHSLVDIPLDRYLISASSGTRSQHEQKLRQIQASSDYY